VQSWTPEAELDSRTLDHNPSQSEMLNQLSHPGTPKLAYFLKGFFWLCEYTHVTVHMAKLVLLALNSPSVVPKNASVLPLDYCMLCEQNFKIVTLAQQSLRTLIYSSVEGADIWLRTLRSKDRHSLVQSQFAILTRQITYFVILQKISSRNFVEKVSLKQA